MPLQYPSTAVLLRGSPDYRRFGVQCFPTASVANVGLLCFKILEHLDSSMTETRHSIRFAPGNHLTLAVADLYIAEPSEVEFISDAERYSDAVEEFNWDNPLNPYDQRFQLCSVMLLGPDASRDLQDSGVVMKSTTGSCPSCVSTGRIAGL
jgi:hypothetical protein